MKNSNVGTHTSSKAKTMKACRSEAKGEAKAQAKSTVKNCK